MNKGVERGGNGAEEKEEKKEKGWVLYGDWERREEQWVRGY